jgi:CRISPR-associated protein Cmr4
MTSQTNNHGAMLFLYAETPLHAGAGSGLGAVDLPLQRERMSGLPMVQGSGLKGAWREAAREWTADDTERKAVVEDLFGPEPPSTGGHQSESFGTSAKASPDNREKAPETWAGAAAFRDAQLLLMPLRTVHGGWAWATCPLVLQRLARDLSFFGWAAPSWADLEPANCERALVGPGSQVVRERCLLIEDMAYEVEENEKITGLVKFLENALPATPAYEWFRGRISGQLVILADEELRHFAQTATEVNIRVRMDRETGTVEKGGLWSEESFPAESLLWTLVTISDGRRRYGQGGATADLLTQDFCKIVKRSTPIRVGGDQTVGRGVVGVRAWEGGKP